MHVLRVSRPTDITIDLYAKQLLTSQEDNKLQKYAGEQKRALIFSESVLEKNILSTTLRSLHVFSEYIDSVETLFQKLNNQFDMIIFSKKLWEIFSFDIARGNERGERPMFIIIGKENDIEGIEVRIEGYFQHPFSLRIFTEAIKRSFRP